MLPLEIYIHIPFCVRKCAYCDFLSAPSTEAEREKYVELLCDEIACTPEQVKAYDVVSVFLGGGTPSLLTGRQLERIMAAIRQKFVISEEAEITLEMNPGTVCREKLDGYQASGVNRLSIGLQSVHNEELKKLGRIHTYEEFLETYQIAREAGFANINVDLISAIPGQTVESWAETLQTIVDLKPEHISAYSLIIEPGTPFYELYGEENSKASMQLPCEDDEREMYHQTRRILHDAGYERYEISNYAKSGYECRHNLGYWERVPYLGFGIGAASFVPGELAGHPGKMLRCANPEKAEQLREDLNGKFSGEPLEREEEMEEFMFLGLRKMNGISKKAFEEYFQVKIENIYADQIEKLKKLQLLEETGDRLYLTEKGIDVSNAVFVEFMFG